LKTNTGNILIKYPSNAASMGGVDQLQKQKVFSFVFCDFSRKLHNNRTKRIEAV
jgi:hypothetical protein